MSAHRPTPAFTAPHRRVMIVLTALLMAYVGVRLLLHPSSIADPQPTRPAREAELADRIDPNTADVHTLATLPGLGEKRAGDIVNHRERFERANPGQRAFTRAQDLLKIDGIGYAMMTQLAPYLLFSQEPSTDPAEEKR